MLAWLMLSGCGITAVDSGTKESTSPCSLSLAFTGPTAAATFSGLNEDSTQCAAASWKIVYEKTTPAAGSYFVSDTCSGIVGRDNGSLTTPYCTVAEVVAAIAQDQSADTFVVHLDGGTYVLGALSHSSSKALVLRGLCSSKTTLKAENSASAMVAMATAKASLKIEGVTLAGGSAPLATITNGTLQLANVRVEHGNHNNCFVVSGSGVLNGQYVAIDGNDSIAVTLPAQTQSTTNSVLLPTVPRALPVCVHVHSGGQLEMTNFHLHDFSGVALLVEDTGAKATLTGGVIEQIVPFSFDASVHAASLSAYNGMFGRALAVEEAATLTATSLTLANVYDAAVFADGDSTTATVAQSYLDATKASITTGSGVGVIVQRNATGTIKTSTIAGNAGPGVFVTGGATATVEDSTVTKNGFANVVVNDATVTLDDNTLSAAQAHGSASGRFNLFVQGMDTARTTAATVTDNILQESPVDVQVIERNAGSMDLTFAGNLFTGNTGVATVQGIVQLQNLPTGTTFRTNCFNSPGPFALLLVASNALLEQNTFQGTYSGLVLHQQSCGALPTPTSPYTVPISYASETMPIGAVHCLCGIRTSDGSACNAIPTGPEPEYLFTVSEGTAIQ